MNAGIAGKPTSVPLTPNFSLSSTLVTVSAGLGGSGAAVLRPKHWSCFESLEVKPSVPVEFTGKKLQRKKKDCYQVFYLAVLLKHQIDDGISELREVNLSEVTCLAEPGQAEAS